MMHTVGETLKKGLSDACAKLLTLKRPLHNNVINNVFLLMYFTSMALMAVRQNKLNYLNNRENGCRKNKQAHVPCV